MKLAWWSIGIRGLFMGFAEILPGISGGTVAYVTGIYEHLVSSLAKIMPKSLTGFTSGSYFAMIFGELPFLLPLVGGMAIGLIGGALFVEQIYSMSKEVLWGFVFGLLLVAIFRIARDSALFELCLYGSVGLLIGLGFSMLPESSATPALWVFFIGGVLAFSAWILPGVSGSMVLLILGIWLPLLQAFRNLQLVEILLFLVGLVVGFLVMPTVVSKLLDGRRKAVLATFAGLVAGSLARVWPWRSDVGVYTLPEGAQFTSETFAVVVSMLLGSGLLLGMMWYERKKTTN